MGDAGAGAGLEAGDVELGFEAGFPDTELALGEGVGRASEEAFQLAAIGLCPCRADEAAVAFAGGTTALSVGLPFDGGSCTFGVQGSGRTASR